MNWFWAGVFIAYAAMIVIEQRAAPWWWCAMMCVLVAWNEIRDALTKRGAK